MIGILSKGDDNGCKNFINKNSSFVMILLLLDYSKSFLMEIVCKPSSNEIGMIKKLWSGAHVLH